MTFSQKCRRTKAKAERWGYIKLKNLCTPIQIISSVQRQATDWKEFFTNYVLDLGIIGKRYVGHLLREFNNKKNG